MNAVILATAGYDHKIHFWEPPSGNCIRTLRFGDSQVSPGPVPRRMQYLRWKQLSTSEPVSAPHLLACLVHRTMKASSQS